MVEENNSSNTPEDDIPTFTSQAGFTDPQTIGNYKILRKIGEGGMGAVYEAEQEKPVKRKVALKLIKWGMDTKSVVARFESERQALALMNHPNIAKVYDAGSTDQGRPYFVMEHVQGVPITQYCDTHRLTTKERLKLFVSVCEAVQHAHQKGIIHRDIKASNVLIAIQDDKPIPKIIDFGVAKATASRLTEHSVYTEFGQMIGTPEYMSPEQAEMTGLDIDTRTDVYSLGVLLYELLVGVLPFDPRELRKSGFDEIRRKIREDEPSRPSTRVSTLGDTTTEITERRKTELPALQRQLKGDLDWITMKALEKDRTRRYQSALELAADINRHMSNEPVLASPPSTLYRMKKFVRRHKVGVSAGLIVSIALIAGIIGTTVGLIRATKAEAKAKEEAETAKQVSDFLVGLFEVSDPSEARGNTITAREVLDKGSEKIERELADQQLVQARLMQTMGYVYFKLGLYQRSQPLLENSLTILRNQLGELSAEVATGMVKLGHSYLVTGKEREAERLLVKALSIQEIILGLEHPDVALTLRYLGSLLDCKEGRSLLERSLAIREANLPPGHPDIAESLKFLALTYLDVDPECADFKKAKPLYEQALAIQEKSLGLDHPDVADTLTRLAFLEKEEGNFDKARSFHERSYKILEKVLGPDHQQVADPLANLGILLKDMKNYEEARTLLEQALEIKKAAFGPFHPHVCKIMKYLASLHFECGNHKIGEQIFDDALEIAKKVYGSEAFEVSLMLWEKAKIRIHQGNLKEANDLLEQALSIIKKINPADDPSIPYAQACWQALIGNRDQAIYFLKEALDLGYSNNWISEDPELLSLHDDPEFEAIVTEIKKRIEKE